MITGLNKFLLVLLGIIISNMNLVASVQNSEMSYEDKILSIAKISGVVYYFNPCKCRMRISEEKMIMSLIHAGNASKNDSDFIFNINKILSEISCGAKLKLKDQSIPYIEKGTGKYRYWKHLGPGTLSLHPPYASDLMKLERDSFQYYKNLPQPDSLYSYSINERMNIILPIAVSKVQYNMFSKPSAVKIKKTNNNELGLIDYRITNIIIAYNILQHFQPYPELNSIPLDSAFLKAIVTTQYDTSREDFLRTIRTFFSYINDSHCQAVDLINRKNYLIPLYFERYGNKIILEKCFDNICGEILPGDIILKIDNVPAEYMFKNQMEQTSSSTDAGRIRSSLSMMRYTSNKDPVQITYLNSNNEVKNQIIGKVKLSLFNIKYVNSFGKDTTVSRKKFNESKVSKEHMKEIDSGIYYIDISGLSRRQLHKKFENLKESKGMVLDFRNYPDYVSYKVWSWFSDKPLISPQWAYDKYYFPFQSNKLIDTITRYIWSPPLLNLGNIPKVFIIGTSTISYGETVLYMYKKNNSGIAIGQPTAACNGNKRTVKLPCGIIFEFTGMRVLNEDNTVYQGKGIHPDIVVHRTIEGIRSQKDEFLDEALKVLKESIGK